MYRDMSHKLYNAVRDINGRNGYVITVLFDRLGMCLENCENLGIFIGNDEEKYIYFVNDRRVSKQNLVDVLGLERFEIGLEYAKKYEVLEEVLLEAMEIEAEDYGNKVNFNQLRKEIMESARLSWYLATHEIKSDKDNSDSRYNIM